MTPPAPAACASTVTVPFRVAPTATGRHLLAEQLLAAGTSPAHVAYALGADWVTAAAAAGIHHHTRRP